MELLSVIKIFYRQTLFIFITLTLPGLLHAQKVPNIEWQKCLGGSRTEDGVPSGSIIQTFDGGYAIAGYTGSNDGDVSGNHNSDDAWIVKLNSSGVIEWQKCFGGTGTDVARAIIQTSDKGYAFVGYTNSKNDGDVSGFHGGNNDVWVVKLDSTGSLQWQKCLGGTVDEAAQSIIETVDGGYAIVGQTNSNDGDFAGKNHGGNGDAFVVKIDGLGKIEWTNCYGGSGYDVASSIIQNSDEGYTVAGFSLSNHEGFVNHGFSDAYIFRIDSLGVIMETSHNSPWQKLLGGTGFDYAYSILHTLEGGYLFVGSTDSNNGDVKGNHGQIDFWLVKLDSDGSIIWQKCFGGLNGDNASSIIKTDEGGYLLEGTTYSNDGDVSGNHGRLPDSSDVWLIKITSSGELEWQKCLGGSKGDEGLAIVQTKDNGYALCARTESNNGDVSGNHGDIDIWVVKLGLKGSIENLSNSSTNPTWVFPNPTIDQAHLLLFHSQLIKKIQIFNFLGIEYFPDYHIESDILSIEGHGLPTGSYMVHVSYQNVAAEEIRKFLLYH